MFYSESGISLDLVTTWRGTETDRVRETQKEKEREFYRAYHQNEPMLRKPTSNFVRLLLSIGREIDAVMQNRNKKKL